MKSKKKTLKNGVRLITVPMKDHPTVTVLVITEAGTINESKDKHGLAHFLEHMAMKGGEKYKTPYAVSSTLDAIGAASNAFTGQEFTGYFAKGNPKHFSKIFDVVSDVYLKARVDEEEISKECGVIIEEINMYKDNPRAYVQDLFYRAVYGDQPAGRHPLGTKESVSSITRDDFIDFMNRHYVAENTMVVVAGDFDAKSVEKEVTQRFQEIPSSKPPAQPKVKSNTDGDRFLIETKNTDQLHINLGVRTFNASDRRVPALMVLDSVLSGGMSGRLFQKLREEMGVCYYIKSSAELNRGHGLFKVMMGIDPKRFGEVLDAVMFELCRLRDETVGDKELKKAKEHLIGGVFMGLEGSDSVAEFFVEQEIVAGTQKTPNQLAKEIRSVKAEDIKKLARQIFINDRLSAAVVGKRPNRNTLESKLTF